MFLYHCVLDKTLQVQKCIKVSTVCRDLGIYTRDALLPRNRSLVVSFVNSEGQIQRHGSMKIVELTFGHMKDIILLFRVVKPWNLVFCFLVRSFSPSIVP